MNKDIIHVPLAGDIVPFERLAHGRVALANDTRLTESTFQEGLTAFAVGYKDPSDIQSMLEFVAPEVPVGSRRFEWKKATNAEEFYSEADDIRAIGADFKRVQFTGTDVTDKTHNKGLTIRVDLDQVAETPNWREVNTGRLLRRIFRNDFRRAITLLLASATNTAKTWDTTALKDPDGDIMTALEAGADLLGFGLNRILFGQTAWRKRALSHRAQTVAGGIASANRMTPSEVAELLGVDEIRVSKERYSTSSTARTQVVAGYVIMFYAESGLGTEDPSNIKRFVSPVEGGGKVRVYEQQVSAKLVDITVEHYSNIVATSTTGLQKITVS
jgi:hypothetical protein